MNLTDTTLDEKRLSYFIIGFLALFSAIYNAFIPLHGDEAYYWVWSHNLQGGYYDHAPMIAYFIAVTNLISESEWGIRLVNVICMSISALYIYKLTELIGDARKALNALIVFASVLLVQAGYTMTTPDSPLILFWTLTLYYGYRALFENRTRFFLLTGLFLGAAMLSKYTGILLAVSLVLFMLAKRRDLFLDWRMYMAIIIASLVVSPMLWWNYQNDWISFTFQLEHGGSKSSELSLNTFFDFLGGQFLIFTPVFTGLLFYFLIKTRLFYTRSALFFIALSAAFPILFFLYKGLYTTMGLNYAAPAYIGAAIIVGWAVDEYGFKKWFKAGVIVAVLLSLIARLGMLFYLEIVQDRMYGNKEAVALVAKHAKEDDAFYGNHLTVAALLSYYLPSHPEAQIPTITRMSQYDLWKSGEPWKDGLYLGSHDPREKELKTLFDNVTLLETYTVPRGIDRTKTFYIYRVEGAK